MGFRDRHQHTRDSSLSCVVNPNLHAGKGDVPHVLVPVAPNANVTPWPPQQILDRDNVLPNPVVPNYLSIQYGTGAYSAVPIVKAFTRKRAAGQGGELVRL